MKIAQDFINEHRAASLATVDQAGNPHVAVVYTVVKPDLTIYFSTRVEGRKYVNLEKHSVVSMAFGDEENLSTLQLMGVAERVHDLSQEQDIFKELFLMRFGDPNWPVPPIKLYERGATNELAFIKVTPYEMTLSEFETTPKGRYKPFFTKII